MSALGEEQLLKGIARSLELDDPAELAGAATDVRILWDRCLSLVEVDEGASLAEQRRVLDGLQPDSLKDGSDIDSAVLARIGMFLQGGPGPLFGAGDLPDHDDLASAIAHARMSLDPASRGRPPGTASLAAEQLALGLAAIWRDWTGRRPAREVRTDEITGRYSEGGPFHHFVSEILALAPEELRQPRKGQAPSPDYVVRRAIEALKEADQRGTEQAQRGLIDETRWLGKPRQ